MSVKGLSEFSVKIRQIKQAAEQGDQAGLEQMGRVGVAAVKRRTPVDTGQLQDSYDYVVEGDEVLIGSDEEYAPHVELGTSKMAAQPHLRPGIEESTGQISTAYANELKARLPK
jgi:HK97 gp10 family phage protein